MNPKSTIKHLLAAAIILTGAALSANAQTADKPAAPQTVVAKSSPAEDALVKASKEAIDLQKKITDAQNDAQNAARVNQKNLMTQFNAKQKDLIDKLKADKKYKPMVDELDALQKQMDDLRINAQSRFYQQFGQIQQQIASDNLLVNGLIPVVRKENNLPDEAVFDKSNQTWSVPAKK